ncbi:hypothetical protein LTR91_002611 [Friedmanniomyces endolithicus]|uniref:C2H2-type domain-containing protein n=1 Tax=Friedmanniomyces endolithicus TaxID=329885 RepID=A0AAN6KXW6_9PEZI|nr:hypothetical protein LTR91_002611 [Friedmanniomyces endolithicus]
MAPVHPRRRPARPNDTHMTPLLIDSFQKMSLRKGDTFHNNNKTEDIWDPLESRSGPHKAARSATCPKSLEDLLIGAGERRTAELLRRVDEAVATNSSLALGAVLSEPEVLPVPNFVVASAHVDDASASKTRTDERRHSHSSDSGIGASIVESDSASASAEATDESSRTNIATDAEERALSSYACGQIHKHIIVPILNEQALKDFHPLIEKVPKRIGNKEIKTLRELEKTLIFLAPEYSRSFTSYLRFCERTIRVLHTTVTTLHESDQRTPADRPYTQGYFFDLVEQIRRYAQILAATRQRQEQGEKPDAMDYSPDENVSVHGGMSHNGKPAELVRYTKDGKVISLATGKTLSGEDVASGSMKRPIPADLTDDEDALRSMARRKKGAKPEIHECPIPDCDKEFKRPCYLTKHIKTHERPWKCIDTSCKYHTHGWPTEKERDRHVNDKHSTAPPEYACLFEPCPYRSKRESNCKQHMEKAHGWQYVRSKSNGKGRASGSVTRLPRGSIPPSPHSSILTPLTPIAPSPSTNSWSVGSRESMPPPMGVPGPSNFGTPAFSHPSPEFNDHFNMNFNFNYDATSAFPTPALSDDRRTSSASSHSGLQLDGSSSISPHELNFGNAFGENNYDNFDFNNFTFQPPSPHSAAGATNQNLSIDSGFGSSHAPHTSPGAQLDQTFTAPDQYDAMNVDEGFNGDFTLFGTGAAGTSTSGAMFPSLPAEGSSWGNLGSQFDIHAPPLLSNNSALDELFPELKGH